MAKTQASKKKQHFPSNILLQVSWFQYHVGAFIKLSIDKKSDKISIMISWIKIALKW